MEPTQYAFERLQGHVLLNPELASRIILLQAMLMGSQQAVLADRIESSWPLETPSDAHPEHAGVAKVTTGAAVKTLDNVVSELGLKSVDFLKLDVDGYEVEALRGARDTLRRFAPLIFFAHAPYGVAEKGLQSRRNSRDTHRRRVPVYRPEEADPGHGKYRLPEIKVGAGINLIAFPGGYTERSLPVN